MLRYALHVLTLDLSAPTAQAAAAQAQSQIDDPLAGRAAYQKWSGAGRLSARVDDLHAFIFIDLHLEPALVDRRVPFPAMLVEVLIRALTRRSPKRFGFADVETVQQCGEAVVRLL